MDATNQEEQGQRVIRVVGERVELAVGALLVGEADVLVVDRAGAWVRTPDGRTIDLETRRPLQRIVVELARRRAIAARIVPHQMLVAAGWPNESFVDDAGRGRLRVAIYELRQLGLRDFIASSRAGHRFVPDVRWESA